MRPFLVFLFHFLFLVSLHAAGDTTLVLKKVIRGNLASKSVVHSGNGLFFAQNMMYKHTISVYNRSYTLVKTIPDQVQLSEYGIEGASGHYKGSPVEVAFTHNGKYAWISNYHMAGSGFSHPGCDNCSGSTYDESYLYRVNTETFSIENVIEVGSVPKYVAACPNNKYVLVSNWSSSDVSVVNVATNKEVKRIKAGVFPRGIAIDSKSRYAYVAIMGGTSILKIDLDDFSTSWIRNVGLAPRHLCISANDSLLYVSLNSEGKIARVNLNNGKIDRITCAGAPRSMVLSDDDKFLYVVNYTADKLSKIDLETFCVVEQCKTHGEPIGITFDPELNEIWVSCYSGSILVFADKDYHYSGLNWLVEEVTDVYDSFSNFTGSFLSDGSIKEKTNADAADNPEKEQEDEVRTAAKEKPAGAQADISPAEGEIYVVVGSFKVEGNAYKLKDKLASKGYTVVTFRNKTGFLCTALGAYTNTDSARQALNKVKNEENMDGWILKN